LKEIREEEGCDAQAARMDEAANRGNRQLEVALRAARTEAFYQAQQEQQTR
jgi:hypothetical protein